VQDVVDIVGERLGRELVVHSSEERMRPPDSEVHQLLGDAARLRAATGWEPKTAFADGLANVVQWMSGREAGASSGAYAI
jgi:nucleoside-diphosphate-sugar epimerase